MRLCVVYVPLLLLKYVGRGESAECDCYHAEEKKRERDDRPKTTTREAATYTDVSKPSKYGNCQFVFVGTRGITIDPKSVLQRAKGKQVKWWRISALLSRDIALLALHAVMLIKCLLRAHALLLFMLRNTPIIGRRVALLGMYAQRIAVCVCDGGRQTPTVSRRKMPLGESGGGGSFGIKPGSVQRVLLGWGGVGVCMYSTIKKG